MAQTFGAQRGQTRCNLTPAARSKGGYASAKKRRQLAVTKLDGMTKLEIARAYFSRGWHQGVRSARRRLGVAA